jgi:RHS repeat-associated protein
VRKVVSTWNGSSYVPQSTNRFVYDGWLLLAEVNSANAPVRSYVWGLDLSGTREGAGGIGGLLAVTVHSGANAGIYLYAYDGGGNVLGLVNAANGQWAAQYEYGPFGELLRASGPLARENPFRFSTKYQDDETDLIYFGQRYYSASLGRWLSRDPIEEAGGLNLYAFVNNDPVNAVDSDGRMPFYAAPAYRNLANRLDAFASNSGNAWAGGVADFLASSYRLSADLSDPIAQMRGLMNQWGKVEQVYANERQHCRGRLLAGYLAAAYGAGGIFGFTGLAEASYGADVATGGELSGVDRWSRGLIGGGSLGLWAAGGLSSLGVGAADAGVGATAAETGTGRLRLNIFGQGEAPGFLDVSTSARYATGTDGIVRPLTTSLPSGSASDIFIRWSPLSTETLGEITRLSAPGTRITLMQSLDSAGAFQSQRLVDALGSRASVTLQRTFTSQFQAAGDAQGILKLLVHE